MFYVYAHENKNSEIIYIGVSIDFKKRLGHHLCSSKWRDEIYCVRVVLELDSENDALEAEKNLIIKHRPKYNSHHAKKTAGNYINADKSLFNDSGLIHIDHYLSLFESKYHAAIFNEKRPGFFYRLKPDFGKGEVFFNKNGEMYREKHGKYKKIPNFSGIKPIFPV